MTTRKANASDAGAVKSGAKKSSGKTGATKKTAAKSGATKASARKTAPAKSTAKPAASKAPATKTSTKSSGRKYSPAASESVERELHEMHEGKLRIGKSGKKVTNPKQAIAIGLSEARRAGKKVPPNPNDPKKS